MKARKPNGGFVFWLAAIVAAALLGVKGLLYLAILRSDGTAAAIAQFESDSVGILWLLLCILLLATAILLLSKLLPHFPRDKRNPLPLAGVSRR